MQSTDHAQPADAVDAEGKPPVPPWRASSAGPIRDRPRYLWPNGASLALYVAVGIEEYQLGGARVEDIVEGPGGARGPELTNMAWRDYGNRVGGFNLIDRLRAYGIRPTVLLNTDAYDTAPDLLAAAREAGAEIVGHGTSNSHSVLGLGLDEERAHLRAAIDRIAAEEGRPPRGWSSPWLEHNPDSLAILADEGIQYTLDLRLDDQPVRLDAAAGGLLAVPYALELNDSSTMVARCADAQDFCRMVTDEFDELLLASERVPIVMSIVVHSFISGVPFRLRQLTRALDHIARHRDKIWFATAGQIADHHVAMTGV